MATQPVQQTDNPFNAQVATVPNPNAQAQVAGAAVQIQQQRQITEVQGAIVMARQFPRDQKQAMDRILNACTRPKLAEAAVYEYARGGSRINGPSIRLAEAIAQNWGNIDFGIRELDQRHGVSTVEAYAWDLETNTRQAKVFQVEHKRYTKKGSYKLEDPRDIYEMVANNGARRLRACILGVIPGDVIESAVDQCEKTLQANADTSPEAQQKMLEKFKAFGITKEMIETRIQRRLDSIQPAQVLQLRKIYNSLKDGMSKPSEWFEGLDSETESASDDLKEKIQSDGKKFSRKKKQDEPEVPVEQIELTNEIDPETGEVVQPAEGGQ